MEDFKLIKRAIDPQDCEWLFFHLKDFPYYSEELKADDGRMVKIKRKMAYVYETPVPYYYGNLMLDGVGWTVDLLRAKMMVENKTGHSFNSVLLNYYKDGKDKINWHSDKEPQLGDNPIIACLNLGAARTFWTLEKSTGIKTPYLLEDGDILIMGENCQRNHLHAILPEKKVKEPRISLTFRLVNYES